MAILRLANVFYTYPQAERSALSGLSFLVERGEYIALVGKNGSGKSTLARLLAGFFSPDFGEIERNKELLQGIVFQQPKDQIIAGIVERDTAFGPKNLALSPSEIEMRTIECLSVVSLVHKAESRTFELSLGQTQRLAFSGILALYPDLFILDEVTAMLDPKARGDLIEFVDRWNQKGHTVIHVTHDEEEALRSKRIIALDAGKIIFDGKPSDFFADKNLFVSIFGTKSELYKTPLSKSELDKKPVSLLVEHLSFSYESDNPHSKEVVFSDLNFSLKKGTLTAITGPSGCGKSTLFECLAGLKTQSSGTMYAQSRPVLALQESEAALFERYAADDVAFGAKNRGLSGKELLKTVQDAMALSGLSYNEFADKNTFALSGGEKRKLSIAGIIALDAEILIFDEPTSALDPQSRKVVIQSLQALAKQGKTVLFSTHRMEEADCADVQLTWDSLTKTQNSVLKEAHNLPPLEPLKNAQMLVSLQKMGASLIAPSKIPDSPINHLNAAAKSALFLILFALSIVSPNIPLCAASFALSLLYAILAHYPLKKPFVAFTKFLPWIVFFAVLQFAFYSTAGDTEILFKWKWFVITKSKIQILVKMFLRAPAIITTLGTFIFSTDERQILDGISSLTKPLAKLGIPVRYAVLTIGITFRFIPILLDEAAGIIKTQIVRGAFAKARGLAKLKILLPLFVPLLMQSLRKARHISDALTARYFS